MQSRASARVYPIGESVPLCHDPHMARASFMGGGNPWPFIGAAAVFVLVTQYVGIAAGAPLDFLVLDTGIGLLFVTAGAVAWLRRPTSLTGPILVLSAALWSLGSYGPTEFEPVWVIGFAFEGYYDVALAFLALTFPAERLTDRCRGSCLITGLISGRAD